MKLISIGVLAFLTGCANAPISFVEYNADKPTGDTIQIQNYTRFRKDEKVYMLYLKTTPGRIIKFFRNINGD